MAKWFLTYKNYTFYSVKQLNKSSWYLIDNRGNQLEFIETDFRIKLFLSKGCKIMSFIRDYMDHGYMMADKDLLQLKKIYQDKAMAHYLGAD